MSVEQKDEKIEIEKFKDLVKEMHKGFPRYVFHGVVEEVIDSQNVINNLVESKFFRRGKFKTKEGKILDGYSLDVGALPLVSAWKLETLTGWLIALTVFLVLLTISIIQKSV